MLEKEIVKLTQENENQKSDYNEISSNLGNIKKEHDKLNKERIQLEKECKDLQEKYDSISEKFKNISEQNESAEKTFFFRISSSSGGRYCLRPSTPPI